MTTPEGDWDCFDDGAFSAKSYQEPVIQALRDAIDGKDVPRFIQAVMHRRAGKDALGLRCMAYMMEKHPGSQCLLIAPTRVQASLIFWDANNYNTRNNVMDDAFPVLKRLPGDQGRKNGELRINWWNGSYLRLAGSDERKLRGMGADFVQISEFQLCDYSILDAIEPMVAQSQGIVYVNGTPFGQNHFYDLYHRGGQAGIWERFFIPINDTLPESFTPEDHEKTKQYWYSQGEEGQRVYAREYECSWVAPITGSILGNEVNHAQSEGHVGNYAYKTEYPVDTATDIGYGANWVTWVFQVIDNKIVFIDHVNNEGRVYTDYADVLNKKPYANNFRVHYMPHDAKHKNVRAETDAPLWEKFQNHIHKGVVVNLPQIEAGHMTVMESNQVVKEKFQVMRFDNNDNVMRGLNHLKNYRYAESLDSQGLKKVSKNPIPDESSHHADALRYAVRGYLTDKKHQTDLDKEIYDDETYSVSIPEGIPL